VEIQNGCNRGKSSDFVVVDKYTKLGSGGWEFFGSIQLLFVSVPKPAVFIFSPSLATVLDVHSRTMK